MQSNHLSLLLRRIVETQPEELDCTECGSRVPAYVDALLAHQDGDLRFYPVRVHLFQCSTCHEEFTALQQLVAFETEWVSASAQERVRFVAGDA